MAGLLILAGVLCASPETGVADPAAQHSLSPISGLFGVPDTLADADLLPSAYGRWSLSTAVANHSLRNRSPREFLLLDGETVRTDFRYQRGIGGNWQFSLNVPWINHSSGGLDRLIDNWHDLFSLPDGIRPSTATNDLDFTFEIDGSPVVSRQTSANGIGDISIDLSRQLMQRNDRSVAVSLTLKAPTGDSGKLTGSGAADIGVAINSSFRAIAGNQNLSATAGAAVAFLGSTDLDRLRNRRTLFAIGAALNWRLTSRFSVNTSIDGRTNAIESDLRAFKNAWQLSVGGAIALGDRYEVRAGFSEDIRVDTHPDIVFRIELVRRSDKRP